MEQPQIKTADNYQSPYPNVEYEKIAISVTAAGQAVPFSHITDVDHKRIIGIAQVISDTNALPSSTTKLAIDGQEVFPSGFESKLIYAGQEVPPDDRFINFVDYPIDQSKVEGTYTDGNATSAAFVAYTANIYLKMLTTRSFDNQNVPQG